MSKNEIVPAEAGSVRLIVCDLDGTLLNSQKLISQASLNAIDAARERGIFVTICTGRVPEMMEVYSRRLKIDGCFIAANGAVIVDTRDNTMPFKDCVNSGDALRLLEFCGREGYDHIAATVEGCYYSKGSERIKRFEQYNEIAGMEGLRQIPLYQFDSGYRDAADKSIYKLLISGLSTERQREAEEFIGTLPGLCFTSSDLKLLDVNASGVNKGKGVRNLARIMGFAKEEICVFGDYHNDISMFEEAGFSIAMANGDDEVKRRAAAVTAANDEDGVAIAIKKYFLEN